MKYLIIQGDGMGDLPLPQLDGRTPLEAAQTPHMDRLGGCGRLGLIHTIPEGLPPGSDVGNLSLFGYDPNRFYTGRSPLEAAAMGVPLEPQDVSFRLNLVTLSGAGDGELMDDYSGGHIDSESAAELVQALSAELADDIVQFYPGVSYRHLMVWRNGEEGMTTTPPHDLSEKPATPHWPSGPGAERLRNVMTRSREIFADHPVNRRRTEAGQKPITVAWLWGQGKRPSMPHFAELYRLRGACISAVDLVRGVAVYAGFDIISVPGATGYLDTNYAGKAEYAFNALKEYDLLFVHIEAPDEAGHIGSCAEKIKAIESIDREIVGPLQQWLPELSPFKMLITSDHATPCSLRTHVANPVPFAVATGEQLATGTGALKYGETEAARTGIAIPNGHTVISHLMAYPD